MFKNLYTKKRAISGCLDFVKVFSSHGSNQSIVSKRIIARPLLHSYGTSTKNVIGGNTHDEDVAGLHAAVAAAFPISKIKLIEDLGFHKNEAAEMIEDLPRLPIDDLERNVLIIKDFFTRDSWNDPKLIPFLGSPTIQLLDIVGKMLDFGMEISACNINLFVTVWYVPFHCASKKLLKAAALQETLKKVGVPDNVISRHSFTKEEPIRKAWQEAYKVFVKWKLNLKTTNTYYEIGSISFNNEAISFFRDNLKSSNNQVLALKSAWNFANTKTLKHILNIGTSLGFPMKSLMAHRRFFMDVVPSSFYQKKAIFDYLHANGKPGVVLCLSNTNTILKNAEKLIRTTSLQDLRITPQNLVALTKTDKYLKHYAQVQQRYSLEYLSPFVLNSTFKSLSSLNKHCIRYFVKTHFHLEPKEVSFFLHLSNVQNVISPDDLKLNYLLLQKYFTPEQIKGAWQLVCYPNKLVSSKLICLDQSLLAQEFKQVNEIDKLLQLLLFFVTRTSNYSANHTSNFEEHPYKMNQ